MNVKKKVQPSTADISKTDVTTRVAKDMTFRNICNKFGTGFESQNKTIRAVPWQEQATTLLLYDTDLVMILLNLIL